MNLHSLGSLSQQYLQNFFGNSSTNSVSNLPATASSTSSTGSSTSSLNQLSPFALLLSDLQKMEQNNPTQYSQVTQKISTHLQSAAQQAKAKGDTKLADKLNTLSTDFSNASQSGQLPNVQDVASSGQNAASIANFLQYMNVGVPGISGSGLAANQSLNPIGIIQSSLNGGA
jgi:hypothetical protein